MNALVASDGVLVPIDSAPYAMEGHDMLMRRVPEAQKYYNRDLRLLGVLLTLYDNTLVRHIAPVTQQRVSCYPSLYIQCLPMTHQVHSHRYLLLSSGCPVASAPVPYSTQQVGVLD